jgi:hypothetical protein
MKKRLLLKLGLVALLGVGLFVAFLWATSHRITKEGYEQLRSGMSFQEVVERLGRQPRYKPGELQDMSLVGSVASWMLENKSHVWESDEVRIYVMFDQDGKATGRGIRYLEPSWLDRVRGWFHIK